MTNGYELIIERVNADTVRLIAFDTDEDTGARSVVDIIEAQGEKQFKWLSCIHEYNPTWTNCEENYISDRHDDVDYGRAKKLSSRIMKVIQQLPEKDDE